MSPLVDYIKIFELGLVSRDDEKRNLRSIVQHEPHKFMFELLHLLFHFAVPSVLNVVVRTPWQVFCYYAPLLAYRTDSQIQDPLLLVSPLRFLDTLM